METPRINTSKRKFVCTTSVCTGDNNELIFRRSYQGDWGHWDDKIEKTAPKLDHENLENNENQQKNS